MDVTEAGQYLHILTSVDGVPQKIFTTSELVYEDTFGILNEDIDLDYSLFDSYDDFINVLSTTLIFDEDVVKFQGLDEELIFFDLRDNTEIMKVQVKYSYDLINWSELVVYNGSIKSLELGNSIIYFDIDSLSFSDETDNVKFTVAADKENYKFSINFVQDDFSELDKDNDGFPLEKIKEEYRILSSNFNFKSIFIIIYNAVGWAFSQWIYSLPILLIIVVMRLRKK